MYTELVLKCCINDDVPPEVKQVLKCLFSHGEDPETLPDHPFFSLPRWEMIGRCSSFYHHPNAVNSYWTGFGNDDDRGGHLFSRSDIKNYDGEIESFIDWLRPYIDEEDDQCIGWTWYEEESAPTLIFKKEPA